MYRCQLLHYLKQCRDAFPLTDIKSVANFIHHLATSTSNLCDTTLNDTTNGTSVSNNSGDASLLLVSLILGYFETNLATTSANPTGSSSSSSAVASSTHFLTYELCESLVMQFLHLLEHPSHSHGKATSNNNNNSAPLTAALTAGNPPTRNAAAKKRELRSSRKKPGPRRKAAAVTLDDQENQAVPPSTPAAIMGTLDESSQEYIIPSPLPLLGVKHAVTSGCCTGDGDGGQHHQGLAEAVQRWQTSSSPQSMPFISLVKEINQILLKPLGSRRGKDPYHYQSIYSLLKNNYVDAFGLAYAVVAVCHFLGDLQQSSTTITNVTATSTSSAPVVMASNKCYLALSEDHVWIQVSGSSVRMEVYESTASSSSASAHQEDSDNSWLYLAGHPVCCTTPALTIAAAVTAMDCHSRNSNEPCQTIQELQFHLLKLLYDDKILDDYPLALSTLAELHEKLHITADVVALHHEAIVASRRHHDNRFVYPHITLAEHYLQRNLGEQAFHYWAEAATVISRYNYSSGDSEIYNEFLHIASHLMPQLLRSSPILCHLPSVFSSFLRFYDGLCKWEEDSTRPVLHIVWAKKFIATVQCFTTRLRTAFHWDDHNDDGDDEHHDEMDEDVDDRRRVQEEQHHLQHPPSSEDITLCDSPEMARKHSDSFDGEDLLSTGMSAGGGGGVGSLLLHPIKGGGHYFTLQDFLGPPLSPYTRMSHSVGSSASPNVLLLDDDNRGAPFPGGGCVIAVSGSGPGCSGGVSSVENMMRPDWLDPNVSIDDLLPCLHPLLTRQLDLSSLPAQYFLHHSPDSLPLLKESNSPCSLPDLTQLVDELFNHPSSPPALHPPPPPSQKHSTTATATTTAAHVVSVPTPSTAADVINRKIPGVHLHSVKMRSLRDIVTAAKLNVSAIELTLTAQSQIHLKRTDLGESSYAMPRVKRTRRHN